MAQASIDLVNREDIVVTEVLPNRVVCRLDIDREIVVKNVKGELKICLKEKGKTVCLKADFLKKMLFVSESLHCIFSFFDHYGVE